MVLTSFFLFFLEFVWFGSLFVMGSISVLRFGFKAVFAIFLLVIEKVDIFFSLRVECFKNFFGNKLIFKYPKKNRIFLADIGKRSSQNCNFSLRIKLYFTLLTTLFVYRRFTLVNSIYWITTMTKLPTVGMMMVLCHSNSRHTMEIPT